MLDHPATFIECETYTRRPVNEETEYFTLEYHDKEHNLYKSSHRTADFRAEFSRMKGGPSLELRMHETTKDKRGRESTRTMSLSLRGPMLAKLKAFIAKIESNGSECIARSLFECDPHSADDGSCPWENLMQGERDHYIALAMRFQERMEANSNV